ncbi:MAG TPA: tRNA pseudouridine(55) synthase TruB [Acholeplasmataceae bacterium]|nr:tRNA pseudouridine(55) synthase TruB [Acholeplasmataceae bacterium]
MLKKYMEGIYLINKPLDISSYDCIRHFKKYYTGKIGHAGTLDPFAGGLLIILLGKAVKLTNQFINLPKTYQGEIALGTATTTYDKTGEVTASLKEFTLTEDDLKKAMKLFQGDIKQTPPIYSALKVKGKKLYQYARRGEDVVIKERAAHIASFFPTTKIENQHFSFQAEVSKGTYIRALAHDLGVELKIPMHLKELTRIKIGDFSLKDAYQLKEIKESVKATFSLEDYLKIYPKITVTDKIVRQIYHGSYLDERFFQENSPFLVYNEAGKLIAYYEPKGNNYKPIIVWRENESN